MSIDNNKDLVTVKGATDMKMLAEVLKQRLKRVVEIVPAKKDGGDEKKGKGGDGNDREEKGGGGGQKKGKKGGGGDDGDGNDGTGGKVEAYHLMVNHFCQRLTGEDDRRVVEDKKLPESFNSRFQWFL
ncbi:hypothetical protein Lser_V15G24805 [Lactuca serriola]